MISCSPMRRHIRVRTMSSGYYSNEERERKDSIQSNDSFDSVSLLYISGACSSSRISAWNSRSNFEILTIWKNCKYLKFRRRYFRRNSSFHLKHILLLLYNNFLNIKIQGASSMASLRECMVSSSLDWAAGARSIPG